MSDQPKLPTSRPSFLEKETPPPVPAEAISPESEKKEDQKIQETMQKNTENSLLKISKISKLSLSSKILLALTLLSTSLAIFSHYRYIQKDKQFTAINNHVENITKEISKLNQENNTLSGQVVSYQKEAEDLRKQKEEFEANKQKILTLENDLKLEKEKAEKTKQENQKFFSAYKKLYDFYQKNNKPVKSKKNKK